MTKLSVLACAAALMMCAPLGAQTAAKATGNAMGSPAPVIRGGMALDARLVVSREQVEQAVRGQPSASLDVVTRPRWHYPAVGAAIGIAAGVVHARGTMQGDYIGLPTEPMYLFPPVYGALGAFLGVLIDSAERERAARR